MNQFTVCTDQILHTMAGGIGASWHAIGPDAFWYDNLHSRTNRGARGSAFGANPPLRCLKAWDDLLAHARWLNFSFMRVEIDRRMFEPARRCFTFDGPEMQTLCRILDVCQTIGAEVFLTHMHGDVEWNAHPGAGRLQSAPRSVDDFAYGLGELLGYLVRKRKYSCIRWLCISNEPGGVWGWWLGNDAKPCSLMRAVHDLREELDRRRLSIALSGPDWCTPAMNTPDYDLEDPVLGAFDAHIYGDRADLKLLAPWMQWKARRRIPFFLSEFGSWVGPNVFTRPNPEGDTVGSYDAQLVNAHRVLGGMNMGVDGFSRWSFVNRGDLDRQFQLVNTWDRLRWDYFERATPKTVPYYTYGILSRFLPRHAKVLRIAGRSPGIVSACVQSDRHDLSLYLLNLGHTSRTLRITFAGGCRETPLHCYQVTQRTLKDSDFRLDPIPQRGKPTTATPFVQRLPARSITAISTAYRVHADAAGVAAR